MRGQKVGGCGLSRFARRLGVFRAEPLPVQASRFGGFITALVVVVPSRGNRLMQKGCRHVVIGFLDNVARHNGFLRWRDVAGERVCVEPGKSWISLPRCRIGSSSDTILVENRFPFVQ